MIATLAALLIVLSSAAAVPAAPTCSSSCVERMAACRAERCPDATGEDRRRCRDACRAVTGCAAGAARIGTVAAVVNECRSDGISWTGRQRIEIRRGDCPPVAVMPIDENQAAPDPLGICKVYGDLRDGGAAIAVGVFQGVTVSLDGETVLFQVTDDFIGSLNIFGIPLDSPRAALSEEGLYRVRADGSHLERLGDQLRVAPFRVVPSDTGIPAVVDFPVFSFSPDGKSVVFVDTGPGADGSEAPQVVRLDLENPGRRHQLTTLNDSQVGTNPAAPDVGAAFIDDERVGGAYYDDATARMRLFTIRRDGTRYEPFDPPAAAGGNVIPEFGLTGPSTDLAIFQLDEMTDLPLPGLIREVFIRNHANVLQLTAFKRSDTLFAQRLRDGERVVVGASADPVGGNPKSACQLFTVGVLGLPLRQLTRFGAHSVPSGRCQGAVSPPACTSLLNLGGQDPRTGAIVFDSTCDEFGVSPVSDQLFAVRPDGSGFRQITAWRGEVEEGGGIVTVELPGPIAHQYTGIARTGR